MKTGFERAVDLSRVVANAQALKTQTGRFVYAVVKANAYGLGAREVSRALADVVGGFYTFDLKEAVEAGLKDLGRDVIAMDQPWLGYRLDDYLSASVRPIVHSPARADELRRARPVLAIDTGMRRFGCEPQDIGDSLRMGGIEEAMTHASRIEQVRKLVQLVGGRGLKLHAAATALLDQPEAWLDAVRPGLALYRGAMRVTARVIEARDVNRSDSGIPTPGRAGYGAFEATRIGVILAGYAQGFKRGVCLVRGEKRKVFEVGMQSAYIELRANEGVGEEVVLLGDTLEESTPAREWSVSEQEVLVRLGHSK